MTGLVLLARPAVRAAEGKVALSTRRLQIAARINLNEELTRFFGDSPVSSGKCLEGGHMRPVNIQYRRYEPVGQSGSDLHQSIQSALSELVDQKQRRQSPKLRMIEVDDKGHAVLNRIDEFKNWTFGELALFNPGQGVPVIIDSEDATVLDLKQMSLQRGQHLIKGVIYYISCGKHVVFIQPPNVSIGILKSYLEWFLCANGPNLPKPFRLEAMVQASGENAPKVRSIGIHARSTFEGETAPSMRVEDYKEVKEAGKATSDSTSTALDMARAAGMSSKDLQLLANLAEGGELVADLRLKLVKDGKQVRFDRVKASDLLSDQENDTISLYGENGKFKGELTRLRYVGAQVQTMGDFLDPDDSRRALIEAYGFFRSNGHIDGDPLET